jgi:hypothetical protein
MIGATTARPGLTPGEAAAELRDLIDRYADGSRYRRRKARFWLWSRLAGSSSAEISAEVGIDARSIRHRIEEVERDLSVLHGRPVRRLVERMLGGGAG